MTVQEFVMLRDVNVEVRLSVVVVDARTFPAWAMAIVSYNLATVTIKCHLPVLAAGQNRHFT